MESKSNLHLKLACIALILWATSLILPGFMVGQHSEPMSGISILLLGLFFGWLTMGWAVYANLFFIYAAIRLLANKVPSISLIIMAILSLTIIGFKGIPRDEGTGVILPVVGWGWGVVLWYMSQVILCLSALVRANKIQNKTVYASFAFLFLFLISILTMRYTQWSSFNTQERELFLPYGMAYSKMQACGTSFTWIDKPIVPANSVIRLNIEDSLFKNPPGIKLPKLNNLLENGFVWRWYDMPYQSKIDFAVIEPHPMKPDFILTAIRTDKGAKIYVTNTNTGEIIYTQNLKEPKSWPGRGKYFCPYSTSSYWSNLDKGYDTAIYNALTYPKNYSRLPVHKDDLIEKCDIQKSSTIREKDIYEWDGNILKIGYNQLYYSGLCSNNYAARVTISGPEDNSWHEPIVWLHDRKTKKPIALFNSHRACRYKDKCELKGDIDIYSIHIKSDKELEVSTSLGILTGNAWP